MEHTQNPLTIEAAGHHLATALKEIVAKGKVHDLLNESLLFLLEKSKSADLLKAELTQVLNQLENHGTAI